MAIKIVANLACSFIGTIAYAVMFQVPRRFYIGCGITGSVGWMIYKFASVYCSVAVASFIGTVCTVLVARMLTVRLKVSYYYLSDFGYYHIGAGSRHLFYGILSGDKSVCYGSSKRDRSNKSGFWNCAWNCLHRICSERSCSRKNTGLKERLKNGKNSKTGKI